MKVRISFTLDIDEESWCAEYGTSRSDVREDVKSYVENGVYTQLQVLGLLKTEEEEEPWASAATTGPRPG